MQIKWFIRNSVCNCFIGYKTMRDFWTPQFSVMRALFMSVVSSTPTSAGSGAAKNPRVYLEHVHDSLRQRVYSPFFFMQTTITSIVYLDML
jgi:hypothetical protein